MSNGQNDQTPPITRAPAPVDAPDAAAGRREPRGADLDRRRRRRPVVRRGIPRLVARAIGRQRGRARADAIRRRRPPPPRRARRPSPDYEAIIEDLLPAGSAVRAGTGAPESGKGYEGDVYIDRSNADVYVFQDDWVWVGNIKANAAENLTGETGASGAPGEPGTPGAPGEPGAPGTAGTQVLLGIGAPDDADLRDRRRRLHRHRRSTSTTSAPAAPGRCSARPAPPDNSLPHAPEPHATTPTSDLAQRLHRRRHGELGVAGDLTRRADEPLERRAIEQRRVPHGPQLAARPQHARGIGEQPRRDALVDGAARRGTAG